MNLPFFLATITLFLGYLSTTSSQPPPPPGGHPPPPPGGPGPAPRPPPRKAGPAAVEHCISLTQRQAAGQLAKFETYLSGMSGCLPDANQAAIADFITDKLTLSDRFHTCLAERCPQRLCGLSLQRVVWAKGLDGLQDLVMGEDIQDQEQAIRKARLEKGNPEMTGDEELSEFGTTRLDNACQNQTRVGARATLLDAAHRGGRGGMGGRKEGGEREGKAFVCLPRLCAKDIIAGCKMHVTGTSTPTAAEKVYMDLHDLIDIFEAGLIEDASGSTCSCMKAKEPGLDLLDCGSIAQCEAGLAPLPFAAAVA